MELIHTAESRSAGVPPATVGVPPSVILSKSDGSKERNAVKSQTMERGLQSASIGEVKSTSIDARMTNGLELKWNRFRAPQIAPCVPELAQGRARHSVPAVLERMRVLSELRRGEDTAPYREISGPGGGRLELLTKAARRRRLWRLEILDS